MSVRVYTDFEQGSSEWFDIRRGMITASTIGALITPKTVSAASNGVSRTKLYELASERISGRVEDTPISWQMERGNLEEDRARGLYAEHYGPVHEVGFITREIGGVLIGFSPDGLCGDDGFIEIKSRSPKIHVQHVLRGEVPPENMAQIMTGLYVTGRSWCEYTSFSNGLGLWTKRVLPDPKWFEAIKQAALKAEQEITRIVNTYETATDGLPTAEYVDPFEEVNLQL